MQKAYLAALLLYLPFCLAWHLSLPAQASEQDLCQDVEEAWNAIEGYPYVWGGSKFEDGGFDCSGAIFKVNKLMGRPVPRTTSKKYYLTTKGQDNHWSEAQCGWLVWWTLSPNRPYGHIGMHVEHPDIWQSGSSTGPTRISFRTGGYWDRNFESSKRFME